MHEVEKNLHVLSFLGKKVKHSALELWLTQEDREKARAVLANTQKPLIALGIGASKERKIWPLESYQKLCAQLDAQFVVIGGPEDAAAGEQLNALNLAGKLTLRESAAVMELCTLFIGNDSGPKHIAAAMQTPVIEISCHPLTGSATCEYNPARFGAWGEVARAVQPLTAQSPCVDGCRAGEAHCILGMEPSRVAEAAISLIASAKNSARSSHNRSLSRCLKPLWCHY